MTMKINKSSLMKKAWNMRKASGMIISMSCALKRAWKDMKEAMNCNIDDLKRKFWNTWNAYKNRKSSDNYEMFYEVCSSLSCYSENEIESAFGKYSGFVLSKIA